MAPGVLPADCEQHQQMDRAGGNQGYTLWVRSRESARDSLYYKFLVINIFKINKFKMNMVYKYVMLQDSCW